MATGLLALLTWREVSATQELAALTRSDQKTRERPVVIQLAAGYSGNTEDAYVYVRLMNVGLGPALRVQVEASYIDPEHQPEFLPPKTVPAIVPGAMERLELPVRFRTPPPGGVRGDGFQLSGTYLDRSQTTEYKIITDWCAGAPAPE
jgi:hypothetical protein